MSFRLHKVMGRKRAKTPINEVFPSWGWSAKYDVYTKRMGCSVYFQVKKYGTFLRTITTNYTSLCSETNEFCFDHGYGAVERKIAIKSRKV